MVATEREYVRALDYTIQNYFPELDRPDVPQGLRGQRAHLFGNLEKLRDFHYNFFLRELEACTRHPPRVAHAFLRHVSSIGHHVEPLRSRHILSVRLRAQRALCHIECCGGKQTATRVQL
jgi:hypothetical protein